MNYGFNKINKDDKMHIEMTHHLQDLQMMFVDEILAFS